MRSFGIPSKMVRVIADIYEDFECAVIDGSETSDWFKIKSGVKQGCVMLGFLFLLALDWIMRKVTADKRRGDTVEIHNSVGGPGFRGGNCPAVIQV